MFIEELTLKAEAAALEAIEVPYGYSVRVSIVRKENARTLIANRLIQVITDYFGMPIDALRASKKRSEIPDLALAKYSVSLMIHEFEPTLSLHEIGKLTNVCHSTVIHHLKTLRNWSATDADIKARIDEVRALCHKSIQA